MIVTFQDLERAIVSYTDIQAYAVYSRGSSMGSLVITKEGRRRPFSSFPVQLGSEVDDFLSNICIISIEELLKILK